MGLFDWIFGKKELNSWEISTESGSKYTLIREGKEWYIFMEKKGKISKNLIRQFGSIDPKTVTDLTTCIGKQVFFDGKRGIGQTNKIKKVKNL